MHRDIAVAKALGASGIALGVLTVDGDVDTERMRDFLHAARPASVTFHRAFDAARDPHDALAHLVMVGVDRVLTAGGSGDAAKSVPLLRDLVSHAGDAIVVMPGGGVTPQTAARILGETGAREIHLRCGSRVDGGMRFRRSDLAFGSRPTADEYSHIVTDPDCVREIVAATR
ncbi:MAG: hypothetical protein NVS1B4_04860 [Gemmatimonadaceae bacterium]